MTPIRYSAAACQTDLPNPIGRLEMKANTDRMLSMIDSAVGGQRRRSCRCGSSCSPSSRTRRPSTRRVAELRREAGRADPERAHRPPPREGEGARHLHPERHDARGRPASGPGSVFNTTCLIGPEGILYKYRKVNPWIPYEVHASPHDVPGYDEPLFPVADTRDRPASAARSATTGSSPRRIRQLAVNGAEVLVRVSAYMDPWGATEPMDWWTVVNRCRALENMAFVVAANQGAALRHYPPYSWPGGSMVVDFDGRILAQASPGPGERIVVGPVDITRPAARARDAPRPPHARAPAHGGLPGLPRPRLPARRRPTAPLSLRGEQRPHRRGEEDARVIACRPARRVRIARPAALPLRALSRTARRARSPCRARPRPARRARRRSPRPAGPRPSAERRRPRRQLGGLGEAHERLARPAPVATSGGRGRALRAARAAPAERRALRGSVAIDLPAAPGSGCPPLRKRYTIAEVRMAPGNACVHRLGRQRVDARRCAAAARVLQGLLAWQQGGTRPAARRGLRAPGRRPADGAPDRRGAPARDPAAAGGDAARRRGAAAARARGRAEGRRGHARRATSPTMLGANVVGLGAALRREQAREGQHLGRRPHLLAARLHRRARRTSRASARGNVVSGASCGSTTGGVADRRAVRRHHPPCQASLSCNSNVCEDRFGRCPY